MEDQLIKAELGLDKKGKKKKSFLLSVWVAGSNQSQSTVLTERSTVEAVVTEDLLHQAQGFCRVHLIQEQNGEHARVLLSVGLGKLFGF